MRGTMIRDELVEFEGRPFPCVDKGFGQNVPVDVVVRPEDVKLTEPEDGQVSGVVQSVVFKGVHYEMMIKTETFTWMVHSTQSRQVGQRVGLSVIPFDIHIMKCSVTPVEREG